MRFVSACQNPSGWLHDHLAYHLLLFIWCHQQTCMLKMYTNKMVCSTPSSGSLMEVEHWYQNWSLGYTWGTGLQIDFKPLSTTLSSADQPVFNHYLLVHPISFFIWMLLEMLSKALLRSKIISTAFPSFTKPAISSWQIIKLTKCYLPWWIHDVTSNVLVLHVLPSCFCSSPSCSLLRLQLGAGSFLIPDGYPLNEHTRGISYLLYIWILLAVTTISVSTLLFPSWNHWKWPFISWQGIS